MMQGQRLPKARPIPEPPPLLPGQKPVEYGLGTHVAAPTLLKALAKVYIDNMANNPERARGAVAVAKELGFTQRLRAELGLES